MGTVGGKTFLEDGDGGGLHAVKLGRGNLLGCSESGEALAGHLRVEEVLIDAGEGAVVGDGVGRFVVKGLV